MRTLRSIAGLTVLLLAACLFRTAAVARDLLVTSASTKWMVLLAVWITGLIAAIAVLVIFYLPLGNRIQAFLTGLRTKLSLPRPMAYLLAFLFALVLPVLVLTPLPDPLGRLMTTFSWRATVFWLAALAGTGVLSIANREISFEKLLAGTLTSFAVLHRTAAFLPDLSTSPFSLGWSEASRYYYASLFLSEKIYGINIPPSVLHPTRYLMQAVPFLVKALPLWVHRAWQVGLWLSTNAAAAWALTSRFKNESRAVRIVLGAWAFLFLFLGPVWFHLAVIVGFTLWGVDPKNLRRTTRVVLAASLWAGVSRINWIPFPAALAGLIYLLEVPPSDRRWLKYFSPLIFWAAAGTAAGLLSQYAYAVLSGNPPDQFNSSFTSDLLWYRLFPSATYPLGVLPGILLVSLPVGWIIYRGIRSRRDRFSPLQLFGIFAILGVFFLGGLVVSVKIGGGSNLHNLDGFISMLMVVGAYFGIVFVDRAGGFPRIAIALAVLVPVGFALGTGSQFPAQDRDIIDQELAELVRLVGTAAEDGGEVLFISERQMVTFGVVENVSLVSDYEKVFLMEMAMSGNETYLGQFERELADHRFALIVSDIVRFNPQDRDDDFGEENNAWDEYVSLPLLCYYEEQTTFPGSRVQLLVPKDDPGPCDLSLAP